MRISDWSSDVCSSDLAPHPRLTMDDLPQAVLFACTQNSVRSPIGEALLKHLLGHRVYVDSVGVRSREIDPFVLEVKIGRASCSERVCQYVSNSVVPVSLTTKCTKT